MGYTIGFMTGGVFAELIATCRDSGSEISPDDFRAACHRLARTLYPDFDDGLSDHLDLLLDRNDRLAAALLIVPGPWGYRIERSCEGATTATIELPHGQGLQESVVSDEEGAAMLGAVANTLRIGGPAKLATPR